MYGCGGSFRASGRIQGSHGVKGTMQEHSRGLTCSIPWGFFRRRGTACHCTYTIRTLTIMVSVCSL